MASAYPEFDDLSEKSESSVVEPKNKPNNSSKEPENVREKAFVPKTLPKDFLRVMLNEQQVNETSDEELARRLQFGNRQQTNSRVQQMMPPNFRGRLQINIIEAQLNKNYGLVKMDPYVRMTINSKVYETPTDYSGAKNPRWNKTIMCYIPNNVDMIKFEVFDEKSFTDDDMIAVVKFPLPDTLFSTGILEEWLPLSGKLGEQKEGSINIRMEFISSEKIQELERTQHQFIHEIPGLNSYPPHQQFNQNAGIPQDLSEAAALERDMNRAIQLSATESASLNSFSDDDLKNLKEMFPTFDLEVIKSLLEANSGNKEATIESILQMSAE